MSTTGYSGEQEKTDKADVYSLELTQSSAQKEGVGEAVSPVLTLEQEKRLWRKVDTRILPTLTLMYLCSFMDRGTPLAVLPLSLLTDTIRQHRCDSILLSMQSK